LDDRIRLEPDIDQHQYRLTLPIAFDKVVGAAVPEPRGLQEMMASPTGFAIDYHPIFNGVWRSDRRIA
jgi:hypothetical protein